MGSLDAREYWVNVNRKGDKGVLYLHFLVSGGCLYFVFAFHQLIWPQFRTNVSLVYIHTFKTKALWSHFKDCILFTTVLSQTDIFINSYNCLWISRQDISSSMQHFPHPTTHFCHPVHIPSVLSTLLPPTWWTSLSRSSFSRELSMVCMLTVCCEQAHFSFPSPLSFLSQ